MKNRALPSTSPASPTQSSSSHAEATDADGRQADGAATRVLEALRASEERFRIAAETANDVVYEWDLKQSVNWWGNIDGMLGYEPGEFPRTLDGWTQSVHPDDFERTMAQVQAHLDQRTPYVAEYRVRRKDGVYRWWSARGAAAWAPSGEPLRLIGSITDITERKSAENELRKRTDLLARTERIAHVGSWEWDAAKDSVIWSEELFRLFGLAPGGKAPSFAEHSKYYDPDDRRRLEAAIAETIANGTPFEMEIAMTRQDGEKRICLARGHLISALGSSPHLGGSFQDITQRNQAEDALRESEDKFRYVFDYSPVGMSLTLPTGEVRANRAFRDMLGYSQDELRDRTWQEISHPDDIEATQRETAALLAGDTETARFTKRYLKKDGSVVWADVSTSLRRDSAGVPVFFMTIVNDITERKRAETALREERDRIRTILDCVGDPIFVKDNDHRITLANRAFYDTFRMDEASVLGHTLAEAVPENERQQFLAVDRQVLDTGVTDRREEELTVGDLTRTIVTRKMRFINASGHRFLVGSIHDVTGRKRAEMEVRVLNAALDQRVAERTTELQQSKELLDQTGRLARVGGWEIDLERNELTWTDVVHQIHEVEPGYRPTVEGGINFYAPEAVPVISEAVRRAVEEAQPFDVELQLITAKNNRIWVRALGEATRKDGKVTHVRGVFQDIHARKLAELELQTYREHLEESNKELEAFSYSVSHDLRAPLRAIDGFARILSDEYGPKLDDEARRVCAIINDNTSRMGRLIDDLLTFSRLGRTEMQSSEIDMGGMARAVYYEVTTPECRARIDLQLDMMPTVVGDPSLMRQVWMNLLSNAVKFSSKRERVVIAIRGETTDGEQVFSVRDNGAGFDMQYVGKLFGVFQRLHSTREFEGNGVGLAIVQRVIRRHGGRVWAEGEPDRGATFSFALPQKGT